MMERALKERIIGAIVLVIFVVLVVPIFLDGPPADGETVSERVLLPGQEDQDVKTVVLDRERSEPIPVVNARQDDAVDAQPAVAATTDDAPSRTRQAESAPEKVQQTAPEPVVEAPQTSAPASSSSTGMWAVQMGSFSNKENAEKLAADLKKQGYMAFLSQIQTPSGQLHRVRIGPQKDRESAEAIAAGLLKVDRKGQVVPHP